MYWEAEYDPMLILRDLTAVRAALQAPVPNLRLRCNRCHVLQDRVLHHASVVVEQLMTMCTYLYVHWASH